MSVLAFHKSGRIPCLDSRDSCCHLHLGVCGLGASPGTLVVGGQADRGLGLLLGIWLLAELLDPVDRE